jgi:hypothetical protein
MRRCGLYALFIIYGLITHRGLGTQLYSAASPNQVIKINAYRNLMRKITSVRRFELVSCVLYLVSCVCESLLFLCC